MCDSYRARAAADQIRWGLDYIRDTYGDGGPVSYANGGWLPNGPAIASNETGEPEPVEYICGPCWRDRHGECRDMRCECCQGDGGG